MLLLALLLLAQPAPDSLDTAAPDSTAAAGDSAADVIYYGGKRAIFLARTEEVVLLDSAWVRYRDMSVYSDSIHYDVRKRLLGAHRAVDFHTASERIAGAQLFYNVDTRRGLIRSARTQVENGFFVAAEAWLVKERVLNARRAAYTTCDREHPHYAFYGPRVKLLMDDVAIAEPVVLRIGRVPVLAAPFWLVPVASKRKSGLMAFKVGNSTDQGYYAKDVSYYWVINDYSDATFYLDIMTRKGIQLRGEGVYIVKPFARGSVQGSYIREWDTRRLRYGFNAAHSSRFFFDTELDAQADFLSDTSYAPDYGEEPLTWLKQDLLSYASLSRRFRGVGRASARVESRSDLIRHTRDLHLPVASFAFSPLRLGGDWDATPSLSFSRRLSSADSAGIDTARTERRSGSAGFGLTGPDWGLGRLQLSDAAGYGEVLRWRREGTGAPARSLSNSLSAGTSQRLFGFLNASENVAVTHSGALGDTVPVVPRYTASLSGSFSLFRVFDVERLNIHGLLHTVTPNFGLNYEPAVSAGGILGRPRFLDPEAAGISLRIANGFQAKVGENRTKTDLGSADISTGYNLRAGTFAPVGFSANVRPLLVLPRTDSGLHRSRLDLHVTASAGFDIESMRLDSLFDVTTTLGWERSTRDTLGDQRGIQLNIDHSLGRRENMLRAGVSVMLPGWRFTLSSLGYNFVTGQLTDYGLSVLKDLHCWELLVNLTKVRTEFRYDFEFRIKKLPDVKFGKSTLRPFLPGT